MKFLADENVDKPIVECLRKDGHEVLYVLEIEPSISYEKGVGVLPQNRLGDHISCIREYFDHLISGHGH